MIVLIMSSVWMLPMLLTIYTAQAAENMPPRITEPPSIDLVMQSEDRVYFDTEGGGQGTNLMCAAVGSQPITFQWTKNGVLLDVNDSKYISNNTKKSKIIYTSSRSGNILVTELEDDDEGYYQCVAKNAYGTSLSKKVHLVKSTKRTFSDITDRRYQVVPAAHLIMKCDPPKNDPPGKLKWVQYYDQGEGKRYVEQNDRIATDTQGNLYFSNVKKSDDNNGEVYKCENYVQELSMYIEGAFSYIEVMSGDSQAQFPVDLLYSSDSSVVALKGERATFQCIFGGNPTPRISWVRLNGKLEKSRMIQKSQKFTISDVQYSDVGTYECRGENAVVARPQTKQFTLKVEAKPEWTKEPQKVDAGVEEKAVFECAAKGKPAPKIEWFINGKAYNTLKADPRRELKQGVLTFRNLSRDDAQVIQCNASNIHGYLWADVSLSIMAYKPEIKAKFTVKKVAEGRTVMLPCQTDGKPNPKIFWKKGLLKMDGIRYNMDPAGNLTIEDTETDDAGIWRCFTQNRYGKATASGELIVRRKTEIQVPPDSKTLRHKKDALFMCSATTDHNEMDKLTITWLHDGVKVNTSNPRITRTKGQGLRIREAQSSDTGKYTCVASNGLDADTASATLRVIAPPDPPTDVSFVACRSRSTVVKWKPAGDNFSPITKYYVEYNNSYTPRKWTRVVEVKDPDIHETKVDLSPYANYTFRVIAVNARGESEPSKRSKSVCKSDPETPDKHPTNVRTDRSKPGFLIIKWDRMPEIEHNGDGFQYVVTIKKHGKTNTSSISDWQINMKEIYYGLIYEPFEIYVEAENDVGKHTIPAYAHYGYTGEAAPLTAPGNLELVPGQEVNATTAALQWDAVDTSPEMMRGEFQGYKVRFWKEGERELTEVIVEIHRKPPKDTRIKRATKETAVITSLPPFSDLEIDIVAYNTYFDSNASNIINVTTPEGVPGPVSGANVLTRGAHHFLLEWDKPKSPNGILTGYQIGYQEVDGVYVGEIIRPESALYMDPDRTRAYLGNLSANVAYSIFFWAYTSKGEGEKYYIDAKTANPGPLLIPTMKLGPIGENFINVTWSVETKSESPAGSSHFVKYRKVGDFDWIMTEEEQINNWMNISDLEPQTQYEIIVIAKHEAVEQGSKPALEWTLGDEPKIAPDTEGSIAQASWFIGMMVAIAVLILLLIIICFIKRSRGEKYNVQEREKLGGTDPEAGDKDMFQEYPKSSETEPLAAGSPDSFDNEQEKLPGGSETDSMAEYGDVDPSKFNEDGSFIGQYGSQKPEEKGNQPSAMSTFV